ncbi:hypothetical protein A6046_02180 [[Haemophilus] ducreyi]|uniref:Opacity associated protein A n=2 Tax=Haemophilus ducreyi TaxID=730 RepID=Q7VNA5_HAEDU|nr:LysM-like peptidoglycan-binding domain-containing protein [[Haemophilus] ducreyi]AAP95576.1 opacity associated protein A [[Haemophilus] ducreyi 35000HP]AKO30655.1 hypothetical protein RY60_02550 [[Haemophilus] ducreyi]AKO32092.1 hypothetical protein RZ57_02555 [[Haemophilus] ducreyi]AKO33548.1 hypothetical protein RZ58_02560 [[Haemophilus] ducreyi]AKO34994.1 hypothetical protein RZ59_02540 [[Haemophilus] ducreyi]
MSKNHFRKEPTFGNLTLASSNTKVADVTHSPMDNKTSNVTVSLRSNKIPGYTFTPIMTRRVDSTTKLVSIEEQQILKTEHNIASVETETDNTVTTHVAESVTLEHTPTAEKHTINVSQNERVIQKTTASSANVEKTESEDAMVKFRRLGLVAALAAVLVGIFFWLKPNTPTTVSELQFQQSGSLPIEFRPIDEEEAKRLEAQTKAEQEALIAQQHADQSKSENTATEQPQTDNLTVAESSGPNEPQATMPEQTEKQPVTAITANEFNAKKEKNEQLDELVKNVEQGKPVTQSKPVTKLTKAEKNSTTMKATTSVKTDNISSKPSSDKATQAVSKTLTVPKATSLMQLFRENGLNISDVNAMSKVNNVVSKLKVGERVTIRVDKDNRVTEMSIGSGGKFTRQSDGTYKYK